MGADVLSIGSISSISARASRRFAWRIAGGRIHITGDRVVFAPNALERRNPATEWSCSLESVVEVGLPGRGWLSVRTDRGTELFRVHGAQRLAEGLADAAGCAVATGLVGCAGASEAAGTHAGNPWTHAVTVAALACTVAFFLGAAVGILMHLGHGAIRGAGNVTILVGFALILTAALLGLVETARYRLSVARGVAPGR